MTIRSRNTRWQPAALALAFLLTTTLASCGGGGGGGGGGDGGGNGAPTEAQLHACQGEVQAAGNAALAARLDAAATCGDVMACTIREDVDGADPEACLGTATASCNAALAAAGDPEAALTTALNGGQCARLGASDVAATLGMDALASRCATVGGGVGDKAALASCLGAAIECASADALAASAPQAPAVLGARDVVFTDESCGTSTLGIHVGQVVNGENGAIFDGIVDGFPGIAPQDGTPDIAGNQLGVGLKAGATEERGIAEFPLAALIGSLTADGITSVVLTVNIDDVLSTFGPGTDFDGTASERVQVYVYSGDGTIALDDFSRTSTPAGTITTGGQGAITDQTLAGTGPVAFELDITTEVKALVAANATHLGIVFATDDANSGTSIDDLGANSSGPPGVGGAKLPFITVNGGIEPEPVCGDGTTDPGEECDDGNLEPGDGCDAACQEEPPPVACGNGRRDVGEECDDGAANSDSEPNACRTNCRNPRCGDGVVDGAEQCDDGSRNSDTAKDACRSDCQAATCGDGVVDGGEECDPPGQSCTATCTAITVDAAAQFIACQESLLTAPERARAEAGGAISTCFASEVGCSLGGNAASCQSATDGQCATAATALASARTSFRDAFPSACVGRPPAELALALGFSDQLAACAAEGLPTTTLADVADCVFRAAACPVTRALGELAAGGVASLASRGALPAELACAALP